MSVGLLGLLGLLGLVMAAVLVRLLVVPLLLRPRRVRVAVIPAVTAPAHTLAVVVHGVAGRSSIDGLVELVRSQLPQADCAVLDYDARPWSNTDPFAVANVLEQELHALADRDTPYREIVLIGHSAGGAILRKAFVWGHGQEQDRDRFGRRQRRAWVGRVVRIVMLAGINRGWSVEQRPANMTLPKLVLLRVGLVLARLLDIGRFTRGVYRGAPFIADTRVQWLRVARSQAVASGAQAFPQVIQLLGDEDDLVSKEDGMDLVASHGTLFRTLSQTNHRDIAEVVANRRDPGSDERARKIAQALVGDLAGLEPDAPSPEVPAEQREVTRVIYLLHGIRDYGRWTEVLRDELEQRLKARGEVPAVVNLKYGYFPLLPFILYQDRQRNVRRFMDEYTENIARYPNAEMAVDAVGHSNGTYILASTLVRYRTPRLGRVFFAGSVVPQHYPWAELADAGRVKSVVNVVATQDWVVAIFPKLFEQIADWLRRRPTQGWLDIGAAGFRGFLDAGEAAGPVVDLKFTPGKHSTGVEVEQAAKRQAIAAYIVDDDRNGLATTFETATRQDGLLDVASNVSYLVWAGLVAVTLPLGWLSLVLAGPIGVAAFLLLVLLLLNSL